MVAIDVLRFRKNRVRQPMQYAWCAATTRNFLGTNADKISKKEIDDLDIGSLCDDIKSEMSESQEETRLTLYMLSMLSYGAVKLFQQQTNSLMDDCQKLMLDLLGGQDVATQKKKKKSKAKKIEEVRPEEQINLSALSIPKFDLIKALDKKNVRDVHLMSEIDFIDIPEINESFGFNPNERDLTEHEMANLFAEMMGHDPQPAIAEDVPQDNQSFEMNDAPMPLEPVVNLVKKPQIPQSSPQQELPGMKTPKKYPAHLKQPGQMFSSPSEAASTAYSPPKKRSRTTHMPDLGADNDDMIASEAMREPSFLPDVPLDAGAAAASPVFDFRKRRRHNISLPLRRKKLSTVMEKSSTLAALFAEPVLSDHVQPESPPPAAVPVADAQVGLPDVSFFDPPPTTEQAEANAPSQSSNLSLAAPPLAAADLSANGSTRAFPKVTSMLSDLSLDAINSFEEHSRKRYIKLGKKIFADRIKQVEIEARPPGFMTTSRDEAMFPPAIKNQSVLSLFSQPATMKNRYLPMNMCWSDRLFKLYRKFAQVPKKEMTQKRKKERGQNNENSQRSNEQNREEHIENLQVVHEQREPLVPNVDMNDEQAIQVPEQRAEFIPQDNQMNVETAEPNAHVPHVDVQGEEPTGQVASNVIHEAAHELEERPIVEPAFEEPRLADAVDQVEAAMSPSKRFKSKDDRDLQDGERRSNRCFGTDELFEIIQSYWNKAKKKDVERLRCVRVEYEKVIRPGRYNGVEAARYFQYCFILENMKKLYLEQAVPYDTVYLVKWQSMQY